MMSPVRKIYLDNAATSFPKPHMVSDAVYRYMTENGCNINRGSYKSAYSAETVVYECREKLCSLFDAKSADRVIFTPGATYGINMVLRAILHEEDHVIVSSMEHNAVMRTLYAIYGEKFEEHCSIIGCDENGDMNTEEIPSLIRNNTVAVITTHVSNVCGTIMPIDDIGRICREHNLLFVVDAAQSAGILNISMKKCGADAIVWAGHKGLMGPQGIGGVVISDKMLPYMKPLVYGGTGSFSHLLTMPEVMPDALEAGTCNIPGIYGLSAGLSFIQEVGIPTIRKHEENLTKQFIQILHSPHISDVWQIVGHNDIINRIGVVSIKCMSGDLAQAAYRLDEEYGIMTRVGLHCAPCAHRALATFPQGTLRISVGYFNTPEEMELLGECLKKL